MGSQLDYAAVGQYFLDVFDVPFQYGKHDCVTFSNTCVQYALGFDPLARTDVGHYTDAKEAYAKVGGDLSSFPEQLKNGGVPHRVLGSDEEPECGDLVVIAYGPHEPMCFCLADYLYTVGPNGIVKINKKHADVIVAVRFV